MIAVVAVGYNRVDSMKRLLDSICHAEYKEQAMLIVSLDKSDQQQELIEVANNCKWPKEYLKVLAHEERLKLKNHILSCGDLTRQYEAVIVLEDDIVVGKYFLQYARACIDHFKGKSEIAGISLYSHAINVEVNRPFMPYENDQPVYLMQFPQSWGQCWTASMWEPFRHWLSDQDDTVFAHLDIPENIRKWGSQSWLKYQIAYCVLNKKYYVYPYKSHTTNCSDVGTHNDIACNSSYQVPLNNYPVSLSECSLNDYIIYDAFFERNASQLDFSVLGLEEKRVCVNLYGFKKNLSDYDYMISTKRYDYEVVKSISLSFRPHEVNLEMPIEGSGIFIYDLHREKRNRIPRRTIDKAILGYDLKDYKGKSLLRYSVAELTRNYSLAIRSKLKHLIK